jgi:hypothetical protein
METGETTKRPAPELGPRDFFNLHGGPVWLPTGRIRIRAGWFGRAVLEYEQYTELDERPAGAAYSPRWWRKVARWRAVPRGDVYMLGPYARTPEQ